MVLAIVFLMWRGGGEVVNRKKKEKKRENSYITIKRGL